VIDRLLERSGVYRLIQAPFADQKLAPIWRTTQRSEIHRVLDVGCGPGTNAGHFAAVDYLGVDINPRYVASARRRYGDRFVVADVAADDFAVGGSFDFVLLNSLLHHLDDDQVLRLLAKLPEQVAPGGHVHIIDLVLPPEWGVARLLAQLDRGSYPRPLERWRALLETHFSSEAFEPYAIRVGVDLWQLVYFMGRPA
jgi:SAM-dependent methyltransferase